VKAYVHARLGRKEQALLRELRDSTGESDSALVRRGIALVSERLGMRRSALDLAGESVGRFGRGPRDLSTRTSHLDGYGR
jgi:hypothetical protein